MTSATSLTMGAETRKESVTPSGTPTSTKPRKSGTAEQRAERGDHAEQRGEDVPTDSLFPARMARVRSAVKKDRTIPTRNTMRVRSSSTLGVS